MIGLVSAAVERRHEAVADEFLELAPNRCVDQRGGDAPVASTGFRGGRGRALGEPGEANEVGEEDAHVLVALSRGRRVERETARPAIRVGQPH